MFLRQIVSTIMTEFVLTAETEICRKLKPANMKTEVSEDLYSTVIKHPSIYLIILHLHLDSFHCLHDKHVSHVTLSYRMTSVQLDRF